LGKSRWKSRPITIVVGEIKAETITMVVGEIKVETKEIIIAVGETKVIPAMMAGEETTTIVDGVTTINNKEVTMVGVIKETAIMAGEIKVAIIAIMAGGD
jgi:hypothetical protein